jgi:hypothetical protein
MRKSTKVITLGLLAASIAACSQQPHHKRRVYGQDDECYVNSGYGYNPMLYYYPIWFYPSYSYSNGHISNTTAVIYRTRTGYHATSGGRVSRANVSGRGSVSVSRGGFGSSGHTVSS